MSAYGPEQITCTFDGCEKPAVRQVRTIVGSSRLGVLEPQWYCSDHAAVVADIEREWDRAEADYYGQA